MTEPTPDAAPAAEETPAPAAVTAEDLAKVQAALDKERELRKAAEKEAKEGRSYKAKVDEIEAASKPELERAVEAARREGIAEATAKANGRLVSAEARALAAEAKFRNPATAVRLLDLSEVSVTDTGEVDADAIKAALEQLGKDEPYLINDGRTGIPSPGEAGIGVGGGASHPIGSRASDLAQIEADIAATRRRR